MLHQNASFLVLKLFSKRFITRVQLVRNSPHDSSNKVGLNSTVVKPAQLNAPTLTLGAFVVNRLSSGSAGPFLTLFLGHADCGTVTLPQFPQWLTHPSHFHSPKKQKCLSAAQP